MLDLPAIASTARSLDALPGTAMRLTSILAREDWELSEVVHAIHHDLALTGRLLRMANSALSLGNGHVVTVGDAVVRLGTGPVLSLAVAAAVGDAMSRPLRAFDVDAGVLWRHSVASALAVGVAGRYCGAMPPQETFVAALLHDVGFLALDRWLTRVPFGQEREDARAAIRTVDHAEISGLVAARWSLSDATRLAIVHHHDPTSAPDDRTRLIASFVHVADAAAKTIGAGFPPESVGLERATPRLLQMDREGFDALCDTTSDQLDSFLQLYS